MKFPHFFPPLFHPPGYQGRKAPTRYFEGWYNKVVDATEQQIWSFIPGISFSADPHSFVQVIEGRSGTTDYVRFPREAFAARRKIYDARVGPNRLSQYGLELDILSEHFSVRGSLAYHDTSPFPQRLFAPGVMGWYTYAPLMECYHGVVSMHHRLEGTLEINGKPIDFTGGMGYIEKDWGRSMPTDWVWTQCNHFDDEQEASLMVSVARIPWLWYHFPGFLSFFRVHGKVYRFATYNGSSIDRLEITPQALEMILSGRKHRLSIRLDRKNSGELLAPKHGEMNRKIHESLDAGMEVKLEEKQGRVIFEGKGRHAGLEIVGDVSVYL